MKRSGLTKCEQKILVYLSSRFTKRKSKKTHPIDPLVVLPIKRELQGLGYSKNSRSKVDEALKRLEEANFIRTFDSVKDLPEPWKTKYAELEEKKQFEQTKKWLAIKKTENENTKAFQAKAKTLNSIMDEIEKTNDVKLYNFYFGEGVGLYNIRGDSLVPNELRIAELVNHLTKIGVYWDKNTTWIISTTEGFQLGELLRRVFPS